MTNMEFSLEALSEEEEGKLRELLADSGSASLPYARGVASAVACEPSLRDPTQWLPLVLGADVPDQAALRHIFSLLMRDWQAIAECMKLGEPYAPHPEDHAAIVQFCKGFIRATRLSEAWQNDPDALGVALPLAVLAGYLDLESLRTVETQATADDAAWQREQRQRLKQTVAEVFQHFAPARERHREEQSAGKVGRNEPCPCGSGKKYKRCCGATPVS